MYSVGFYIHLYKWLSNPQNERIIREKQPDQITDEIMFEFTEKKKNWNDVVERVGREVASTDTAGKRGTCKSTTIVFKPHSLSL